MLTLIFASGNLDTTPELADLLTRAELIIAADGGANHCERLGIVPTVLIGDLDSVDSAILEKFESMGVAIHRHPPAKDATDLELALDLAQDRGTTALWLFGALGGRWDMSLGNILLCARHKYRALPITIPGPDCRMEILRPGKPATVRNTPGRKVSLLPLQEDVHGLTLDGFKYPLRNATLRLGSTQGISNVLLHREGTVLFQKGVLLCVCLAGE